MKACSVCKEIKVLSDFGSHSRMRDGKQTRCKSCIRKDSIIRKGGGRLLALRLMKQCRSDEGYCGKCKAWLPRDQFTRSIRRPDGIEPHCKSCHSAYRTAHYRKDPSREQIVAREWRQRNHAAKAADTAGYRAKKRKAMPPWADASAIKRFYEAAAYLTKISGEPWHVDHVVPLRGRLVSGLHVQTNLQLLPGRENQRKGNRLVF